MSGTDIGAYISYLKNDYAEQERQRKFKEAKYIGFQEGSYWLLSSGVIDQNFAKVFLFCGFFFLLEDLYGRLSAIHRTVVPKLMKLYWTISFGKSYIKFYYTNYAVSLKI